MYIYTYTHTYTYTHVYDIILCNIIVYDISISSFGNVADKLLAGLAGRHMAACQTNRMRSFLVLVSLSRGEKNPPSI